MRSGARTRKYMSETPDQDMTKHEETESVILLHCLDAAKCRMNCAMVVQPTYTDGFDLLLDIYVEIPKSKLYIEGGRGNTQRLINIQDKYVVWVL